MAQVVNAYRDGGVSVASLAQPDSSAAQGEATLIITTHRATQEQHQVVDRVLANAPLVHKIVSKLAIEED